MPPSVHTVGLPDGHDLHDIANWLELYYGVSDTVPIPAGEHRDIHGVRFSCPPDGADCEVTITTTDGLKFGATSTGGKRARITTP